MGRFMRYELIVLFLNNAIITSLLCVRAGGNANNFIVGLTNISPVISRPRVWNYTLCGQYPGGVAAGATVSLYCQDNLPPFRYVIVQINETNHYLTICELQVFVKGT